MNKFKIITSWDDGHPLDLKLADLLEKHQIPAIFYIPIKNNEGFPVLNAYQIADLSKRFEIGGHTYNHIDLTTVDLSTAEKEIFLGKKELENITGKKIASFCFPRGHYNQKIIELVKKSGFKNSRTARLYNANKLANSNFVIHPNLHFYPHSKLIDLLHCIKQCDLISLSKRCLTLNLTHINSAIPILRQNFSLHLWGHSWEIEQYNLWKELEALFKNIVILNSEC